MPELPLEVGGHCCLHLDRLKELVERSTIAGCSVHNQLENLLWDLVDIFASGDSDIGRMDVLQYRIDTETAALISLPSRRLLMHHQGELQGLIQKTLISNVMRPSTSNWAAPRVLVKTLDGTLRLCVDYRFVSFTTH